MRHWTRCIFSGVVVVLAGSCRTGGRWSGRVPQPDPRVGLHGGKVDSTGMIVAEAASASWNMRLLSNTRAPAPFLGQTNSDLAFRGKYAIQGNYAGPLIWDISDPSHPVLARSYACPASQNDVSVYRNLMFVSSEAPSGRLDCGAEGVRDTVSTMRMRGVRIFDVSDITNPRYIANVQTCRGSHTHTLVTDPKDPDDVYIYVSGSGRRALAQRAGRVFQRRPGEGPQLRALPDRSDQGAAGAPRTGRDRQLAADLQRPRAAADPRRGADRAGRLSIRPAEAGRVRRRRRSASTSFCRRASSTRCSTAW